MASTIQKQLQGLLAKGLQDPRIQGLVTVTDVRVTEDLATATVSVSVLPAEKGSATIHGLRAASGFLRRELGKHVEARRLPALRFELDESIKREAAVLAALGRVRAEREAQGGAVESDVEPDEEAGP
jgi:ribosome-binding factor A